MKRIKLIAIMVSGLLATPSLFAQEKLTLQQAIRYALEHKVDAQKSKLDIANAENKIDETRSSALPQISANGGFTYNPIIQQNAIDIGALGGVTPPTEGEAPVVGGTAGQLVLVAFGTPWVSSNTVTLNQQIFNQALFTGLKAAKTSREFYRINHALTEEQLIEKIANAYYEVFQTQQTLKTVQTNLDNTRKSLGIIKGLYESGLQKKIDLDRMQVAVTNLESQKQQTLNGLELQNNALKFAMGMDISRNIVLPEETFQVDISKIFEEANSELRTEILLMDKQAELLELNKKATIAEYYPTVSMNANYGVMGFSRDFFLTSPRSSQWADFSAIGLTINIPIFNGFATRSKVRQAEVELQTLRYDRMDTKLALDLANENAKSQLKNSILVIRSNEDNVKLAKEVLADTENNYKNGLATLTELLDAEKAFADAQNNYTTSLLDYKVAEVQLIKAKGELRSLINE
ncbi:TolC family protein [Sphingobacterium sp. lm-10]|uniref:TolC family protein n=1 Tax=Sphingobacterium sp. lm-10 TaxID=2944904 RepID=UPI002022522B|nr:TolC family protein [Sphingobacterium sp. lm-10]MCL7987481.1 TolC family protein [Sphingobacterium sp. lm-10]